MGLPSYASKCVSGNIIKNDSATVLHTGDGNSTVNNLSLIENLTGQTRYGARTSLAVSPNSSGNLGTRKAVSGGLYSNIEKGNYIGKKYTSTINQSSNTFLRSGAADVAGGRRGKTFFYGYQRLNITSWNAVTGAATEGSAAGVTVLASGLNGVVGGTYADHANSYGVPAELTYMTKGTTATQDDYKASTNP
jgi:hypothetical protein